MKDTLSRITIQGVLAIFLVSSAMTLLFMVIMGVKIPVDILDKVLQCMSPALIMVLSYYFGASHKPQ